MAKLGEVKEEVSKEARLLYLADPAGIAESQITGRIIVGRRRENVCAVEVQTTSLQLSGPITRWKGKLTTDED